MTNSRTRMIERTMLTPNKLPPTPGVRFNSHGNFWVHRVAIPARLNWTSSVMHTFMKSILTLFALSLLLTACTTTTSDAAIRRHMIGVWSLDSDPTKVIENRADGSYVMKRSGIETVKGTWQVKNGYAIGTVTNAFRQDGAFQVESNKVLRILGDEMVVLSIDGHTQLTCHRQ